MKRDIKQALIDIVGPANFSDHLIDLVSYSYDASHFNSRPFCGLWPQTVEQVSQVLKVADREKIPVIPRGAGTGLAGMAVPVKGGIVLDLNRMNRIRKISIEDRLAVVEPGVVYASLETELSRYGFFFPRIPPAERYPRWAAMSPPTPAASKAPSTEPPAIMSWASRSCWRMVASCEPAPVR